MKRNITDPELRDWMMPTFTTTTDTDAVVSSVLMMGAIQPYFSFGCGTCCGIPSVTLLGVRSDWQSLEAKLDKLGTLGTEPAQFVNLLRPVLSRFVRCFDEPAGEDVVHFWQLIFSEVDELSGQSYYNGWITAFCFWDEHGSKLGGQSEGREKPSCEDPSRESPSAEQPDTEECDIAKIDSDVFSWNTPSPLIEGYTPRRSLELDGVTYHAIDSTAVPPGYASVPVRLVDKGNDGRIFDTNMVAGSVGMEYTGAEEGKGLDSLQPVSGRWIFIDKEVMEADEENSISQAQEYLTRGSDPAYFIRPFF